MKKCTNILSQAKGLMFSKRKNLMFVFDKEKKISIHTWFVFFPIDVLFLDSSKRVVEVKERFVPFSFFTSTKRAKYVIEVNHGVIARSGTKVGDLITFK